MSRLLTIGKARALLVSSAAALALVVASGMVPLAMGGSNLPTYDDHAVGVSDDQVSVVADQQNADGRFTDLVRAIDEDQLHQISAASSREDIELVDQDTLRKAIEEKQNAVLEAKKAEAAAQEAKHQKAAAIAAAKQAEAEAAKQKAEQATKKAETVAQEASVQGNDWTKVVASCYYDVGLPTASGSNLDASEMTIAHKSLPLGTKVELSYKGRTCTAVVRDRGPYIDGRDIDLAPGVQSALGLYDGVTTVQMRLLG